MTERSELGKIGEDFAAEYVKKMGFKILHRNWRIKHRELDIVAMDGDVLVIIEVKTRTVMLDIRDLCGYKKVRAIESAAIYYAHKYGFEGEIRIDLAALTRKKGGFDVVYIKNAFR